MIREVGRAFELPRPWQMDLDTRHPVLGNLLGLLEA